MLTLASFALLALHVSFFGLLCGRILLPRNINDWSRLGATGCLGFACVSLEVLLLGYLNMLSRSAFLMASVPILALGAHQLWTSKSATKKNIDDWISNFKTSWRNSNTNKLLITIVVLSVILLVASCFRAPLQSDELEYHWAAPLFWAAKHKWTEAPFKLVNGPCLAEWLYTWSAVWHSSTTAHLSHLFLFFMLLLGAAGIGSMLNINPIIVIAGCLASPVALNQATVSYNDVAMASFLVNAFSVLFAFQSSNSRCRAECIRTSVAAGTLLGAGYLTKSLALGAFVSALAYQQIVLSKEHIRSRINNALLLTAPLAIAVLLGVGQTFYLTGKISDPSRAPYIGSIPAAPHFDKAIYIARDSADIMLTTGAAAGRIPTLIDLVLLPMTPVITAIWGQREPYGGRTGLVLLVFLPLFLFRFVRSKARDPLLCGVLSTAIGYFIIVAPIFIKTRFNIFVWTLLTVCSLSVLRSGQSERHHSMLSLAFLAAVLLGILDAARNLIPK